MARRPFAMPSLTRLLLVVALVLGGGSGGLTIGADAVLIKRIANVEMALVQLAEPANVVCTLVYIMDSLRRARDPKGRDLVEDDETHVFFVMMSLFFLFCLLWMACRLDCIGSDGDLGFAALGGGCCCVVIACILLFAVGFNNSYDTAVHITLAVFISLYVMMLVVNTYRSVADDTALTEGSRRPLIIVELPFVGALTVAFLTADAALQLDKDLIPHKVMLRLTQDFPAIILCCIDVYSSRTTPTTITNVKFGLSCFFFVYHAIGKFLSFAILLARHHAGNLNVKVVPVDQ